MKIYVDKGNIDFITACLDECNVFDYIADELQYKDKLKLNTIDELEHNQNQKAIECLKEVKNYIYDDYKNCEMLRERKNLTEYGEGCFESDADYIKFINSKIKELEGE